MQMQIKQEVSTSSKNQAKTIEADWLLGESFYPWANSKDSCLLSSAAGNTEHFLSPHFLQFPSCGHHSGGEGGTANLKDLGSLWKRNL